MEHASPVSRLNKYMKKSIVLAFTLLLFFGCDSKFIDDLFTFNIEESHTFTIPAGTPAGKLPEGLLTIPIPINDSVAATHNTSMSLLKSARITKLQFTFAPSTFSLANNVDTLDIRIDSDNQPMVSLGYYSTGMDTIRLTHADFAPQIKDVGAKITGDGALKTGATEDIQTTVTYTITFTAHPF
jgi:hypothetical protein